MDVQFAGRPDDGKFLNKRAEMWWRMAEWIKGGGMLPKNDQLLRELIAPKYGTTRSGKFFIEEKAEIKKRLGHSVDISDALACTFFLPEQMSTVREGDRNPILAGAGPVQADLNYHYRRQSRGRN
jgi:hypothetical protein